MCVCICCYVFLCVFFSAVLFCFFNFSFFFLFRVWPYCCRIFTGFAAQANLYMSPLDVQYVLTLYIYIHTSNRNETCSTKYPICIYIKSTSNGHRAISNMSLKYYLYTVNNYYCSRIEHDSLISLCRATAYKLSHQALWLCRVQ